jgi:hypothetical protein
LPGRQGVVLPGCFSGKKFKKMLPPAVPVSIFPLTPWVVAIFRIIAIYPVINVADSAECVYIDYVYAACRSAMHIQPHLKTADRFSYKSVCDVWVFPCDGQPGRADAGVAWGTAL